MIDEWIPVISEGRKIDKLALRNAQAVPWLMAR
jgi:hypothetical protein